MKSKFPISLITILIILAVGMTVAILVAPGEDEVEIYMDQFSKMYENYNSFAVEQVVKKVQNNPNTSVDDEEDAVSNQYYWMDACITAHHAMAHNGATFDPSRVMNVNGSKVQCDGFGFVGLASYLYGITSDTKGMTSVEMSNTSFNQVTVTSPAYLIKGDVLYFPNSVEVLYECNGNDLHTISWSSPSVSEELYKNDEVTTHDIKDCSVQTVTKSPYHFKDIQTVYREGADSSTKPPVPTPGDDKDVLLNLPVFISQSGSPQGSWLVADVPKSTCAKIGCCYCSYYMVACYWKGEVIPLQGSKPSFEDGLKGGHGIYTSGDVSLYRHKTFPYFGVNVSYGDYITATIDQIKEEINKGNPVIYRAMNNTKKVNGQTVVIEPKCPGVTPSRSTHFVVIMGYNDAKQCFYLYDPAKKQPQTAFTYEDYLTSLSINSGCQVCIKNN